MTAQEITREYKADYNNYLRPKLLSIASSKKHDLKVAKGKWIPLRDEIKVKTPTGNLYNLVCKLRWDKKLGVGWSAIKYLITSDSRTGKKSVYVFSDSHPIMFSSSFLRELKTSLSDFLRIGASWEIMDGPKENPRYSAYIDFGGDIGAGVGGWEEEVLVLRHLIKDWKIDPVSEFLEGRKKEEESCPKSEIDMAWEAYLNGTL